MVKSECITEILTRKKLRGHIAIYFFKKFNHLKIQSNLSREQVAETEA